MISRENHLLVAAVVIIVLAGSLLTIWTAYSADQAMRDQLLTQSRLARAGINPDQVADLTGSTADLDHPPYLALKQQMVAVRSSDPDLRFAYLIGQRSDGTYFFFVDSEPPESEDYSPPGQDYPEVTVYIVEVFHTGIGRSEGPASDRWGTWVSGLVPILDPETGKIIAVFGIDVDARDWYKQVAVASLPPVAGTLLVLVLVLTFFFIQQRNDQERRQIKASEQAIRESEERYRLLFTQSPVGIVQIDRDGQIVTTNSKFSDIIGVPCEKLTGFNTLVRIKNPALVAAIKEALQGNVGFFEGEYVSVMTGKRSILRMVSQPIGTNGDRFTGAIGIFEDITERRQAEEKEKQQAELFLRTQQALVQMAKLPSDILEAFLRLLTEIDSQTLAVSRVSVWWFSKDFSELICADCFDLPSGSHSSGTRLERSDYPRYFAALDQNRILAAHDAGQDERTNEFLENYLLPLNITSMLDVPVRRGGQVVGVICHEHTGPMRVWDPLEQDFSAAVADLVLAALERADRLAAEEALRESELRYRNVVEDQTELISRFTPDGIHVFVNDAYCRFFNIRRSQIIGKKISPDIPNGDQILIRDHLASLSVENPVGEISHRIVMPDGQVRWLRWFDRAIFNEQGELIEYQSVGRDITWQKHIEDTLYLTNQKLNLLSNITRHDILNQIHVLNGYLGLISGELQGPENVQGYVKKAMKAVTTIENQIRFTRDYQEMGSKLPSWQNLNEIIIRAKGALQMVDVRVNLHRPGLEILADPLLEKVFYNLLDNAIRHGGSQLKTIQVTSREGKEGLVIVFEDDGEGIDAARRASLFQRGYGKNAGLGLFLSREILSISGITIEETSDPGKGARFEITVPRGGYR